MTEIERIILDHLPLRDSDGVDGLTKAIEQYVIKARIEELEKLLPYNYATEYYVHQELINERIAQLKKGLTDD